MSVDRYPANPLNDAAHMAEELRDLKRRLTALEGARNMRSASVTGGTTRWLDADGNVAVEIGEFTDGERGIRTVLPDGTEMFRTDGTGFAAPAIPIISYFNVDQYAVTGSTFETAVGGSHSNVVHPGLALSIYVETDVGTTGEVRVGVSADSGSAFSNTVTIASGATGSLGLNWLHGLDIPTVSLVWAVQLRRTSGAGEIRTNVPVFGHLVGTAWPDAVESPGLVSFI